MEKKIYQHNEEAQPMIYRNTLRDKHLKLGGGGNYSGSNDKIIRKKVKLIPTSYDTNYTTDIDSKVKHETTKMSKRFIDFVTTNCPYYDILQTLLFQ
jgi:hypothetical protein